MKYDTVIYHANCLDGFGSAYIVWLEYGDQAEYIPHTYGQPAPDVTGKNVLMVDYSFKHDVMLSMLEQAKSITVLDHHKTAEQELLPLFEQDLIDGDFAAELSGVGVTWKWFHGEDSPLPGVFRNIQDRDLWKFKLANTKETCAALYALDMNFHVWNDYLENVSGEEMYLIGSTLIKQHTRHCEQLATTARMLEFEGYTVPFVNAPWMFASELGNTLAKGQPFAVVWHKEGDCTKFSLRSTDEGEDVSEIAKKFGGGGHRNAAGFVLKEDEYQ